MHPLKQAFHARRTVRSSVVYSPQAAQRHPIWLHTVSSYAKNSGIPHLGQGIGAMSFARLTCFWGFLFIYISLRPNWTRFRAGNLVTFPVLRLLPACNAYTMQESHTTAYAESTAATCHGNAGNNTTYFVPCLTWLFLLCSRMQQPFGWHIHTLFSLSMYPE